ncbi:MAG: hypothetical protein HY364_05030 [Candidatus Aenigmarchaeota archaeon]|nr:hypothetical protein [Candidatus Aenigmarchaeota archaeon]
MDPDGRDVQGNPDTPKSNPVNINIPQFKFSAARPKNYRFSPETKSAIREFWRHNGKTISIAVVSLVMIILFYSLNQSITGYVTRANSLEARLSETNATLQNTVASYDACKTDLGSTKSSFETCSTNLNSRSKEFASCTAEKDAFKTQSDELGTLLSSCNADKEGLSATVDSVTNEFKERKEAYDTLAKSAARLSCCTALDVITGRTVGWGIIDNSITCGSSNYTINCATGATNY